jgi:hypothetical protein
VEGEKSKKGGKCKQEKGARTSDIVFIFRGARGIAI